MATRKKKELTKVEGVLFDKEQHTYWSEAGLPLMGVTSLMKKHGLAPDYSGIAPEVLAKAAERGTEMHALLEAYDNGEAVPQPEYLQAYKRLRLKVLASEYMVTDGEMVASFIDKVLEDYSLADVKTTSEVHTKALEWQLSIYAYLFERQNPTLHVPALYCIHVRPTGPAKLIPINRIPDEEVAKLFECERNGEIYVDERQAMSVTAILNEEEAAALVNAYGAIAAMKATLKAAEESIKEYEQRVLQYMVDNNLEELTTPSGGAFRRKAAYTRESLDTAKLKAEHPRIYEQYRKAVEVKGSIIYKSNN